MVILAYSFAAIVQIILLVWKGTDCENIPGIEHTLDECCGLNTATWICCEDESGGVSSSSCWIRVHSHVQISFEFSSSD